MRNETAEKIWKEFFDTGHTVTLEDTGDGSGDAFVPIPEEILEALGWDENTELIADVYPNQQVIKISAASVAEADLE